MANDKRAEKIPLVSGGRRQRGSSLGDFFLASSRGQARTSSQVGQNKSNSLDNVQVQLDTGLSKKDATTLDSLQGTFAGKTTPQSRREKMIMQISNDHTVNFDDVSIASKLHRQFL